MNMKQISIINAVKIVNQRVKPFDGEKEYLATGGLVGDNIVTEKVTYKDKPSRADLLAKENQLIVAKMKGTNKVFLVDNNISDYIFSTGFLVLEAKENWSPNFLFHLLQSKYFQEQKDKFSSGATQKAINNEKFKEILIPDIPLEDQKRIAKILDQAENLIQKRKQTIDLLDEYLKSKFLELFGDPVNNPKKWEIKTIGDIVSSITSGSRGWAKYYSDSGSVFITIKNVGRNNKLLLENLSYVKPPLNAEARRTRVKEGDVLLSITADLGRSAVVQGMKSDAYINQHLAILRLKEGYVPEYVAEFICSDGGQLQIQKLNKGAAKAGLNFDDVKSIKIPMPPLEIQEKFSLIKNQVRFIDLNLKSSLEEIQNLFNALMQKAFNGELIS